MLRSVIATFKGQEQLKEALEDIRIEALANSQISVVTRTKDYQSHSFNEEIANELTYSQSQPSPDLFNAWLVFTAPFLVPDVGEIIAAGPLAHDLIHEPENTSLSDALLNYGLSQKRAEYYEQSVSNGHSLLLVQTEPDKVNALCNTIQRYGGRNIEKWHKELEHPLYPAH